MYRQCAGQRTKVALLFKIFKNVEMDPWTHTNRRKVLSRKPVSEGPLSVSQAWCLCWELCPQSRTLPVISPGRLSSCWGGGGVSQVTRVIEEAAWQTRRAGGPPDTRPRRAGKALRSKADARVSCDEESSSRGWERWGRPSASSCRSASKSSQQGWRAALIRILGNQCAGQSRGSLFWKEMSKMKTTHVK